MSEQNKAKRPGNLMGTMKRLISMLFRFYPVLLPFTIGCILVNACVSALPSLFQQRIIALIELSWQDGDWAGVRTDPSTGEHSGFHVCGVSDRGPHLQPHHGHHYPGVSEEIP